MRAVDSRELLLKASQMGKANLGPEDSKMWVDDMWHKAEFSSDLEDCEESC